MAIEIDSHGWVQLPAEGSGKKLHAHFHDHNETGNPSDYVWNQVMSIGGVGSNSHNIARVNDEGAILTSFAEGATTFDAFGKTKVSNEYYLGSYTHADGKHPDSWYYSDQFTAPNTKCVYNQSASCMELITNGDNGDTAWMETHYHHPYHAGSGNLFIMTIAATDTGKTGVRRRWGGFYGDETDGDGLFFELDGTQLSFVVKSDVGGSVSYTKFEQSTWEDPLDGTGLSGMTLNVANDNIYWFDFQYLGAGRVRFGVVSEDGVRRICGEVQNANIRQTSYMSNGNLPMRVEQTNTTAGTTSTMRSFLGAVIRDGELPDIPAFYGVENTATVTSATGERALMITKPKKALTGGVHNTYVQVPWEYCIANNTDQDCIMRIYWGIHPNGVIASGFTDESAYTTDVADTSGFMFAFDETNIDKTAARLIFSCYLKAGEHMTKNFEGVLTQQRGKLLLDGGGHSYLTMSITWEPVASATGNMFTGYSWKEY